MLSHGKTASPFIHTRQRGSAPASKSQNVGGAGPNANSRDISKRPEHTSAVQQLPQIVERRARRNAVLASQQTTNTTLKRMMELASTHERKANDAQDPDRTAHLWIAQAIAADIARRLSH